MRFFCCLSQEHHGQGESSLIPYSWSFPHPKKGMTTRTSIPAAVWANHTNRLRRLACHKQYTQGLVSWLLAHGIRPPFLDRLSHCHTQLRFVYDPEQSHLRLSHTYACNRPLLCPLCAIRRAVHAGAVYQQHTQTLLDSQSDLILSYAVLTIQNQADLRERFDHLQHAARLLIARRQAAQSASRGHRQFQYARTSAFASVVAGAYSFEIKRGANSGLWHPHLNLLLLSSFPIPPAHLTAEWHTLTQDSSVTYCQPRPSDPGTFVEIFKYALKFADLSYADTWEVYRTVAGRKLLGSFGAFRGLPRPSLKTPALLPSPTSPELTYQYADGEYHLNAVSSSVTPSVCYHVAP